MDDLGTSCSNLWIDWVTGRDFVRHFVVSRVEIGLSSNDEPPVMLGATRHKVKNVDGPSNMKRRLERYKELLDHDQYQEGTVGANMYTTYCNCNQKFM